MRKSAPASRRCVAYEWRRRCGETRFSSWARVAAPRQASHTTFGVIGLSARQFCDRAGKQPRLRPHPAAVTRGASPAASR